MAQAATQAAIGAARQSDVFQNQMSLLNQQLSAQEANLGKGQPLPKEPSLVTPQTLQAQQAPQGEVQKVFHAIGAMLPGIMGAIMSSNSGGAGAAMGSMFALHGFYAALNQGNLEQAKLHAIKTDELMREAQQQNAFAFAKYNAILKQGQLNMEQKLAALKVTAMQLHDVQMEEAAQQNDLYKAATLSLNREKAAAEFAQRGQALAEKMTHDQQMAALAAQRVGLAAARLEAERKKQASGASGGLSENERARLIVQQVNDHNNRAMAEYKMLMEERAKTLLLNPNAPMPTPPRLISIESALNAAGIKGVPISSLEGESAAAPTEQTYPGSVDKMAIGKTYVAYQNGKKVLVRTNDGKTLQIVP
jgi:hypothetical protein